MSRYDKNKKKLEIVKHSRNLVSIACSLLMKIQVLCRSINVLKHDHTLFSKKESASVP